MHALGHGWEEERVDSLGEGTLRESVWRAEGAGSKEEAKRMLREGSYSEGWRPSPSGNRYREIVFFFFFFFFTWQRIHGVRKFMYKRIHSFREFIYKGFMVLRDVRISAKRKPPLDKQV